MNNDELRALVARDKAAGSLSEELAQFFVDLVERKIYGKWLKHLTWKGDWAAHAINSLIARWRDYDPDASSNPYAFYCGIVHKALHEASRAPSGLTPNPT